jgi:predicted ATPase
MIKSVHFKNFKALIDVTLPLNRFTLIVGPNGSGKSTAMQAIYLASHSGDTHFTNIVTANLENELEGYVEAKIVWALDDRLVASPRRKDEQSFFESLPSELTVEFITRWERQGSRFFSFGLKQETPDVALEAYEEQNIHNKLSSFRVFSFDAEAIPAPVLMRPGIKLESNGSNLAGVLENLRDSDHERFESLNEELGRWLPEFDRIAFETPAQGQKAFMLRTRVGGHKIRASNLSHGTLFALAFLTLAYLPNPPSIVCFEEPERGIHPRLLREVRDAMYRLCYPEQYGEKREPVQVIATTHSPYFLDLYKDHPEEIVIAHKDESGVHFERLSDKPNVDEFLQDAPLGEVWYSGILGGVPNNP